MYTSSSFNSFSMNFVSQDAHACAHLTSTAKTALSVADNLSISSGFTGWFALSTATGACPAPTTDATFRAYTKLSMVTFLISILLRLGQSVQSCRCLPAKTIHVAQCDNPPEPTPSYP